MCQEQGQPCKKVGQHQSKEFRNEKSVRIHVTSVLGEVGEHFFGILLGHDDHVHHAHVLAGLDMLLLNQILHDFEV